MKSLDSIVFDTSGFAAQGQRGNVRIWRTASGDGIGLYYFPVPPDIDADIDSVDEVRAFYRRGIQAAGGGVIEIERLEVDGCKAIRTIFKIRQPSSMAYLGSLTLPFRDFSYVIKIQCTDQGVSGTREAIVLDTLLKSGAVTLDESGQMQGWTCDRDEQSTTGALARNKSESDEYDAQFPNHPLSRIRQVLMHVQRTLKAHDDLKHEAEFKRRQ